MITSYALNTLLRVLNILGSFALNAHYGELFGDNRENKSFIHFCHEKNICKNSISATIDLASSTASCDANHLHERDIK